jgi:hypothetical protein
MANIIVFNTTTHTPSVISVTGTTWGEIKSQIPGYFAGMKVMIKETKLNVDHDQAEMPVGIGKDGNGNPNGMDYTLFLMPSKQKGAINDNQREEIKDWAEEVKRDIESKVNELLECLDTVNAEISTRLSALETQRLAEEAAKLNS